MLWITGQDAFDGGTELNKTDGLGLGKKLNRRWDRPQTQQMYQ